MCIDIITLYFIEDFPTVDFVIFNDGSLEYRSIATCKYISFLHGLRVVTRNLAVVLGPAALALIAVLQHFLE